MKAHWKLISGELFLVVNDRYKRDSRPDYNDGYAILNATIINDK